MVKFEVSKNTSIILPYQREILASKFDTGHGKIRREKCIETWIARDGDGVDRHKHNES